MKYKYTKEQLEEIIKDVLSIAELCRRLNIRPAGGNYKSINKYIKFYDIDISHFTGQGWNTGLRYKPVKKIANLNDILVENSTYTSTSGLRKRLVKEGIKENKCEICDIETWNNKPITFHLDHINGNNMDNRLINLRMLCPNCHSQTDTYCGNKIKASVKSDYLLSRYLEKDIENTIINSNKCSCGNSIRKESKICKDCYKKRDKKIKEKNICLCGNSIRKESKICVTCSKIKQRKVERPSYEQLLLDIKELGYSGTGRKYGVSDNSIRKWIKNYMPL